MLSSTDVAGLFQSQNSMFMGQNSYAQQIGVSSSRAPSFSPAASFSGSAGGSRAAGLGMSAIGAGAQLGAGMMFDPFGSFLGGAAGAMGRGGLGAMMGGGMAAALPMIPLAIGAQMTIGAGIRGGQQQNQIASALGGYNFMNSQSRTGQGFTRQDAQQVGDSIRQLSHIPEMMSSVEELTKLMPKLKASGVMSGVRSAQEFQSRFKEAVGTIRDMSKVLGTTMEEAEQFFAHSRSVGFTGRAGQLRNTLNAQLTSGLTGMSTGQVMSLQQAGAGMATQVGARRSLGATAVTNMAQTLGKAQQEGRLSEGALEDMTGLQGGEAIQAASQRMTEAMYNFSQRSPVGKLMMAGLAKFDKSGKAIGLDDSLVRQLQSGAIGIEDLKRRASNLTNDQKISFTQRQAGTLAMDLAGKVGIGGVGTIFQNLVGGKGTDADRLVMSRNTGLNESEVDVAMSLGGMGMGDEQGMGQMARLRAREASFKERTDPSAILKRMKTKLHASLLGGIEQAGSQIFTSLGKQYDEFVDDIVGRHIVSLSKEGTANLQKAMSGGSKKELYDMFSAASGLKQESATSRKFGMGDVFNLSQGFSSLFTSGGRDSLSKLTTGSDFLASLQSNALSTGRDAVGKQEHGDRLIGDLKAAQALDTGSGLDAAGRAAMQDAQGIVRGIAGGIEGFDDMDADKKLDMLRSAIKSRLKMMGGNDEGAKKLKKAMEAATRGGAKDAITGLIGGTGALEESMAGVLGSGTGQFYGVKEAAKLNAMADEKLKDAGLGDGTISLIKSNPEAKKALNLAQSNEKVRSAIMKGDVEALRAEGISVGPNDMAALRTGLREVEKAGETGSGKAALKGAFEIYDAARKNGDLKAIQGAFNETAGDINNNIRGLTETDKNVNTSSLKNLATALAKFGSGEGNARENFEAVGTSISAYSKAIREAKTDDERSKLIAAGGSLGESIGGAQTIAKGLSGKVTQDQLLQKFGFSKSDKGAREMLARAGVLEGSGGVIGKGVDAQDLADKVAGYKGMAAVAAGRTEMAGETSLPKTLDKLNKTIDLNTAALVVFSSGEKGKLNKDMVDKSVAALNETGKAPQ